MEATRVSTVPRAAYREISLFCSFDFSVLCLSWSISHAFTFCSPVSWYFSLSAGKKSDVAAQGSQEAGAVRTAPASDPALRFDFDDDVAGLVERLNYLGTHSRDNSNQNNAPSAAQEGLQLLQAARSRGMKDARLYKAVFKVRQALKTA